MKVRNYRFLRENSITIERLFSFLTFFTLRHVAATLALGNAKHLREHTFAMAHAEAQRYRAHVAAAALAGATLLRAGTLEVVTASGPARHRRRLVRGTLADALQIHAGRTAHAVFLFGLHQAAVHRRTRGLARCVAAEERPRRIRDLQRLAGRTDRRQRLGLAATGHRRTRRSRAAHVDQLARLTATWTGDAATGIAALTLGTAGALVDLRIQRGAMIILSSSREKIRFTRSENVHGRSYTERLVNGRSTLVR